MKGEKRRESREEGPRGEQKAKEEWRRRGESRQLSVGCGGSGQPVTTVSFALTLVQFDQKPKHPIQFTVVNRLLFACC